MTDLRCFCSRKPLLAVCGTDTKSGQPYVHVKSVKGARLNVEMVVVEGIVRLRCRDCLRWHTIRIVKNDVQMKQEQLPPSILVS